MTWTYDPNKLAEEGMDAVRFLVRDTDATEQLVQNEEILFSLSQAGQSIYAAAAALCRNIAAYYMRKVSLIQKDSGINDDMQKRAEGFLKLAEQHEERAGRTGLTVFAGGISQGDKESRQADVDAPPPAFRRDLHQLELP